MELTLANLKKTLEHHGFSISDIPRNDKLPYDTLFVGLGDDFKGRPLILNIRLFEQAYEGDGTSLADGTPTKMYFLNFLVTLPFIIFDPAYPDLSRLILMLNKVLPVPGFGMSEMDKMVYYQYTYPSINGKIDSDLILTFLALIIHYVNLHGPTFEDVGTRVKSLKTVLEESAKVVDELQNKE